MIRDGMNKLFCWLGLHRKETIMVVIVGVTKVTQCKYCKKVFAYNSVPINNKPGGITWIR